MFFSGSSSMVWPFLFLFAVHPTFHDRALDTIHEALTIAGGSYFCMRSAQASDSRWSCVPHSVQVYPGYLSGPIGNTDHYTVCYCFHWHNPNFYILIFSQGTQCKFHSWRPWKVNWQVAAPDALGGTRYIYILLGTMWRVFFRPWLHCLHRPFSSIESTSVRTDPQSLISYS